MNIVAHEDDDLLFMNPDVLNDIRRGRSVRTVYVTAGDAGKDRNYWQARATGIKAAYARMAGVALSWSATPAAGVEGTIKVFTLDDRPSVSLVFMNLPDGSYWGDGFPPNANKSLEKLLDGRIQTISTVGKENTYTRASLEQTLLALVAAYGPECIRIQDVSVPSFADHSDHRAVARMAKAIAGRYESRHRLTSYRDYVNLLESQNVFADDFDSKQEAFSVYAAYDSEIRDYKSWWNVYYHYLRREYVRVDWRQSGK